jgi:hypothetical protein
MIPLHALKINPIHPRPHWARVTWIMFADIGFNVTPNSALPLVIQNQIRADAEAGRRTLERDLDDLKYYPVAKISLTYHF